MRRVFIGLISLIVLIGLISLIQSCSKQEAPDTAASDAAQAYYDMLLENRYSDFVSGMYLPDSIPESYREQLVANIKMFLAEQQKEHNGIVDVAVLRQERDSLSPNANVFLLLNYGDSMQEEIVQPMVEHEGIWYMK